MRRTLKKGFQHSCSLRCQLQILYECTKFIIKAKRDNIIAKSCEEIIIAIVHKSILIMSLSTGTRASTRLAMKML